MASETFEICGDCGVPLIGDEKTIGFCSACKGSGVEFVSAGHGNIIEEPCSICGGTGISQEERNKLVLGALIAWIAQSSVGVLSFHEASQLIKVLEGSSPPEAIGLGHKVKAEPK